MKTGKGTSKKHSNALEPVPRCVVKIFVSLQGLKRKKFEMCCP